MAKRRKVANLLGLAVLSVLVHRPMHPYEIAGALRGWGKESDIPVKWGSLYSVVQNLAKHGFIEVAGTTREGNRPERTSYRITDAGMAEMSDWTRELLSTAEREAPRFRVGLSVMAALPPDEVATLLTDRITALDAQITALREELDTNREAVPRLFLIENEYDLARFEAEADWMRRLRDELTTGTFPGLADWRAFHGDNTMPQAYRELAERNIAPE
ncbi:PadR family transcriptional regulator [Stackebrandtia albiflava]|uniref:PadR family transcriptional regulator n=1 Tax=Stackebrandtia albiflava TaxID=406432 RepID=A0A562V251_9ACTN|nr:PadR family transcriptional regulator [Stackebrandtia albiflava]TWJ11954.1 PadR family transcriptional regulator [Stackebrandtia albiflava]